jgi:hypothetical protein
MARNLLLLASGCAWAVMMFLLFQREVRPYFEYQAPPSYRQALSRKKEPELQKRAVFFGTVRIGEAETLTEPLEAGGARIRSRLLMRVQSFFQALKLPDDRSYLSSEIRLDSAYQVSEFRMDGRLQGMPVRTTGNRQGEKLLVSYNLGDLLKDSVLLDFPRDATLSDNFLPYQGGTRLAEGKKWKMKILDVGSLVSLGKKDKVGFTELYAAVTGRDRIALLRGREVLAFKVEVRKDPNDERWPYLVWVDEDGTVLKQHMKINGLICETMLEEQKTLTAEEAKSYEWSVQPPR